MAEFLEGHTVRHYDGELNHLHILMLEMGGLALDQCVKALHALEEEDLNLAREVIRRESDVDALELKLDADVWWEIGRRNPVARDLRVVMVFSKAATDLERIGDEAARIAHTCIALYGGEAPRPSQQLLRDVYVMGKLAIDMVREAITLFDALDAGRAQSLLARHPELDTEFQSCLRRASTFVLEDARNVGHAVSTVVLVKAFERIGDHARNLAEYMIYLVRGEDVRHSQNSAPRTELNPPGSNSNEDVDPA